MPETHALSLCPLPHHLHPVEKSGTFPAVIFRGQPISGDPCRLLCSRVFCLYAHMYIYYTVFYFGRSVFFYLNFFQFIPEMGSVRGVLLMKARRLALFL